MTIGLPQWSDSYGLPPAAEGDEAEGRSAALEDVQLLNGNVWLAGSIDRGQFRRLSDFVNHSQGRILLRNAVLQMDGSEDTGGRDAWIEPADLDLIGQTNPRLVPSAAFDAVPKKPHRWTILTSTHLVRGTVYRHTEAAPEAFLQSDDRPLIAMTDAEVSWIADRRVARRFAFLLLNKRRIFAAIAD